MGQLHLSVDNSVINGKTRRVTTLREDGVSKPIEIYHEFDRIITWNDDTVIDGHIFIIMLYAMLRGKPVMVHGNMSRQGLRNVIELQLAWARWKPEKYQFVDIIPDRIIDKRKESGNGAAITAFSGGVDSVFTALRHTKVLSPDVRYPLKSALMVHGFDVDVYNFEDFGNLVSRVKPITDDLGFDLRILRTNSRDLKIQDWDNSSTLELAGCLHMYYEEFDFGLIGSSKPYEDVVFPSGSNPLTDNMMSGNLFSIVNDGAGFCRTAKIAEIAKYPLACEKLKVCWAATDQSVNCGKCEKCVRTQLSFLAAGMKNVPPCFPQDFSISNIKNMEFSRYSKVVESISVVKYADKHNVTGQWLDVLKDKIANWKEPNQSRIARKKNGGLVKSFIVKLLLATSFGEDIKRQWRSVRRVAMKALF